MLAPADPVTATTQGRTALRRRLSALAALPLGAAALAVAHAAPAHAAFPGTNGRVAFTSDQDGGLRHVFVTSESGITDLTGAASNAIETQPEFSPSGREIVFTRSAPAGQPPQIAVMPAGGGARTVLTHTAANSDPTWSPDGGSIAFGSVRSGTPDIYVMRGDGTQVRRITHDAAAESELTWAPRGDRIAFVRVPQGGGDRDIWSVPAGGGAERDLTNDPTTYDVDPAWSPDGTRIAYSGAGHPHGSVGGDLWVMNADGSGAVALEHESNGYSDGAYPAWSPDGTTIAFTANDGTGFYHVWSVAAGGGENAELVANRVAGGNPLDQEVDWQPGLTAVKPPTTRLSGAAVKAGKGRASFAFSGGGLTRSYQCSLSRGHHAARFTACRAPESYIHLRAGHYTFRVRAVGPGGHDRTPAIRQFRIH
jgi:Tol biopolymer transport system component